MGYTLLDARCGVQKDADAMNDSLKRGILIGAVVLLVVACGYYAWSSMGRDEIVQAANTRVLMCSETGELFEVQLTPDFGAFPHQNPKTGTMTLYPTEICYWNQCGDRGGTRVILNHWLGEEGPTHCPVCGHVVRRHNPAPPDWQGPP